MNVKKTQESSKPRIEIDKIGGEETLKDLYAKFSSMKDEEFKEHCKGIIKESMSSNVKKEKFYFKINTSRNKSAVLKLTQDFILAGIGYGV